MIGVLAAVFLGVALYATIVASGHVKTKSLVPMIMGGYVLRLLLALFIREVPLFSHGAGGDCITYEYYARIIARLWERNGIHFLTAVDLPELGPTSLPPNLFALVASLDQGTLTMRLGCTAFVALAAGLTALNLYSVAVEFGASRKNSLLFATLIYFQPAFLFYTCDMYKDGLVLCFTFGALASALRLSFRLSFVHIAIGLVCVWALWFVRFYLIFVTTAPLLVGVVGLNGKGVARSILVALALVLGGVVLAGYTDILQLASDRANETFERATSDYVIGSNAQGGSGIMFEDGGSPYSALLVKLFYTVFAPLPWTGGSLGFQLGKIDAFLWYFVVYRAVRGAFQADKRLVVILASFILPCTLMYAMSMSNVGLIVRQRLVIVAATTLLATFYEPKRKVVKKTATVRTNPRAIVPRRRWRPAA